jgi:glycosyltransferase involved in cell wall biosynthesis
MPPILSIIVPAYNVEYYISQCLDSIINVIPKSGLVEIIVVDDGSKDDTALILMNYFQFDFVKIITQCNQGASAARNIGIDRSRGKYIGFLDADDYWEFISWEKLMAFMQLDADIIEFNMRRVDKDGYFIDKQNNPVCVDSSLKVITQDFLTSVALEGQWSFSTRFFNRKAWKDHRFSDGLSYEDLWLLPMIYASSNTVITTSINLVCYRKNDSSTTQIPKIKHAADILMAADMFFDLSQQQHIQFYEICSRKAYGVAVRVASRIEVEQVSPHFWCLLNCYRKKAWSLVFTLDFRFLRYFLFPKLSFIFSRRKYIRSKLTAKTNHY